MARKNLPDKNIEKSTLEKLVLVVPLASLVLSVVSFGRSVLVGKDLENTKIQMQLQINSFTATLNSLNFSGGGGAGSYGGGGGGGAGGPNGPGGNGGNGSYQAQPQLSQKSK
jgi:hypothetical protein